MPLPVTAPAAEPAPEAPAAAAPATPTPPAQRTHAESIAAATARLQEMDAKAAADREAAIAAVEGGEPEAAEGGQPAEPEAAEAEAEPAKDERRTALLAKLANQDRELQTLRSRAKQSVTIEELRADPVSAIMKAGHSPQKLLDLWLEHPSTGQRAAPQEPGAADPRAEPERTPAELAKLQQQVDVLARALQQRDLADQQRARAEAYQAEVQSVLHNLEAGGDRWEMIAARSRERGLAANKGGAIDLAIETAQEIYRQRLAGLTNPSVQEQQAAAPSWEEVLDAVEDWLVQDWKSRQEPVAKVKKLQSAAPAAPKPAAKPAARPRPTLPAQGVAPTPSRAITRKGPPTIEDIRRATARLEEMDRKLGQGGDGA